jgi:hypothetical protein
LLIVAVSIAITSPHLTSSPAMTQSPLVHLTESAPSPLPATPEGYLAGADYRDRVPIVIDHGEEGTAADRHELCQTY